MSAPTSRRSLDGWLVGRVGATDPAADGELFRRFVRTADEAAFAALLHRLAPLVYGVCRRALGPTADADDAFQATFLVLVKKAAEVRTPDRIAAWVYGVAVRVARKARMKRSRDAARTRPADSAPEPAAPLATEADDLRDLLDAELALLPDKYRLPLVLCGLGGRTHEQAAAELGWPVGTVAGRLSRAKAVLRDRLTRRGLAGAAVLGGLPATAAPRSDLLEATFRAAIDLTHGEPLATVAGAPVVSLTTRVVSEMKRQYLSVVLAAVAGVVGMGVGVAVVFAQTPAQPTTPPVADTKEDEPKTVADGNARFAFDFYARLRERKGNVLVSPHSLSSALALAALGADGETETEMLKTLRLPARDTTHPEFAQLRKALNTDDKSGHTLRTANAVFGQKGYPWREAYLTDGEKYHGAGLVPVDYADPDAARKVINAWASEKTEKKIPEAIDRGVLRADTRMVLVNAVYFRGDWLRPFDPKRTRDAAFHAAGGDVQVPTMNSVVNTHPYHQTDAAHVVTLHYKNGDKAADTSLLLVLPKKVDGLADIEKDLTAKQIGEWVRAQKPTQAWVSLPKFQCATTTDCRPHLEALGMKAAFASLKADFGRMADPSATPDGRIWFDRVVQKAVIEVDETGSTAAAVTVMAGPGGPPKPAAHLAFDSPFLFLIRHDPTGTILFLGRVVNPKG